MISQCNTAITLGAYNTNLFLQCSELVFYNFYPIIMHAMKILFPLSALFNLFWLIGVFLIIFCRLKGESELIIEDTNSPTSLFISIPMSLPLWLCFFVFISGAIYLALSIYIVYKLRIYWYFGSSLRCNQAPPLWRILVFNYTNAWNDICYENCNSYHLCSVNIINFSPGNLLGIWSFFLSSWSCTSNRRMRQVVLYMGLFVFSFNHCPPFVVIPIYLIEDNKKNQPSHT